MAFNRFFTAILTIVAVAGFAHVASAQYMYMDTNGNGIHDPGDRLNANNDSTAVDIYLSTNTRRDGTTVTCNVDPGAAMAFNAYAFNVVATGGTVTYGNYINRSPFPNPAQLVNPGDGTYKNAFYSAFVNLPAGLHRLGTLTITGVSGSPRVDFVDIIPASQDFTMFAPLQCPGYAGDNTYRLDGPNTRAFYGAPGDWFDTDGLPGGFPIDTPPVVVNPGNKTVNEQTPLTFTVTASDPDAGQTLTFSLALGSPAATGATINATSGAFSWTPTEAQGPGVYPVMVTATDNAVPPQSGSASFTIAVNDVNTPPVLAPIGNKAVTEGTQLCFTVLATDGDIPANTVTRLISGAPLGATFNTSTGEFCWTPSEAQGPGVYTMTVCCVDNGTPPLLACETFTIAVTEDNRAPTADAGGPYTGSVNANVAFDGRGSFDPDGDALTYAWDFGDGATGTGSTPSHAHTAEGTYNVTLRVTDPDGLYDDDATTATVRAVINADILLLNNGSTIDVKKTGNRSTTIGLEETAASYSDLIPGSIRISTTFPNSGFVTECAADTRSFVAGDMDADGVPDLDVRFANKCLANLLNNVPDNSVQTIVITGEFASGSGTTPLHAERDLTIRVKHRNTPILVVASPNPFNPETSISYTVRNDGPVTMRIYGIDGRLVRTLKLGDAAVAGTHEVTWDGTYDNGRRAPSGIYLVRVSQTFGGAVESATLKITVAK